MRTYSRSAGGSMTSRQFRRIRPSASQQPHLALKSRTETSAGIIPVRRESSNTSSGRNRHLVRSKNGRTAFSFFRKNSPPFSSLRAAPYFTGFRTPSSSSVFPSITSANSPPVCSSIFFRIQPSFSATKRPTSSSDAPSGARTTTSPSETVMVSVRRRERTIL